MMTLKQDLQFNIWVVLVSKNNRWFAVAVFLKLWTQKFSAPKNVGHATWKPIYWRGLEVEGDEWNEVTEVNQSP